MNLVKTFTKLLFVTLLLVTTSQRAAYADGGFPVRPGRLLISPSVSYFFANSQWDSVGNKVVFPHKGRFSSTGISLYGEYGISRRFAVVVALPYQFNHFTQDTVHSGNNVIPATNTYSQGPGDLETGLRYYLANIEFVYYISLQATAITPLYNQTHSLGYRVIGTGGSLLTPANPNLGYGQEGAELKLAISGSGHLFGRSTYFNAADGVREYFGQSTYYDPSDQAMHTGTLGPIQNRYNGTFGISLDQDFKNQVSATISGIYSISTDKSNIPSSLTNRDFSFMEASLSFGHSFTDEISLFLTGGRFLTGRNTSIGTLVSLAFVYRLDYR